MAHHSKYWSCTPFADWLRGTAKLQAGTAEEWDEWTTTAKMKHNFRYWLAEEFLGNLQDFVTWPTRKMYDLKYYINNRWITRTHALTAHRRDIKPGEWRDVGNRFLPCLFNELVEFVEVELAWWQIAWCSDKEVLAKYKTPFWAKGWWRVRTWRCKQAGLDNLDWQSKLRWAEDEGFEPGDERIGQLTPQAKNAQEILDLYKWWTEVYHQRPDPHDASGWTEYCARKRKEYGETGLGFMKESADPDTRALGDTALKKTQEIEAAYEAEDEEMMIRLIKVRNSLWT
jgi:hypothetical protein